MRLSLLAKRTVFSLNAYTLLWYFDQPTFLFSNQRLNAFRMSLAFFARLAHHPLN